MTALFKIKKPSPFSYRFNEMKIIIWIRKDQDISIKDYGQ